MKVTNAMQIVISALAAVLLAIAIGSCGKAASEEELQIDSNTNWLKRCEEDAECSGSLRCYCGQCSQPCSESSECGLLAGAECASSGGAVCAEQPSAGGLCVLGCLDDAGCGPDFTCTARQCVPQPCAAGFKGWDQIYQEVASDARTLDADGARFARYVSVANRWTYNGCTLPAAREGLSKLVNSLSLEARVVPPTPIDVDGTLYRIDLREYGWDRSVAIRGVGYSDVWEALVALDPFAPPFVGDDSDDAVAATGARVPLVFANSLIATATTPDIYYGILGIPGRYGAIMSDFLVADDGTAIRAGYVDREEIIATHRQLATRAGYVWDLGIVGAAGDPPFVAPLRMDLGERQLIFSLPNGLQGFAYTLDEGLVLPQSPTLIDTYENDFRGTVPRTPLRQHSPRPNIRDELRDNYRADAFTPADRDAIDAAYPGAASIAALLEVDYQQFTRPALEAARVDLRRPEPITTTWAEYDRDLSLEDVAGELLISSDDLEDNLALLDPAFDVLRSGRMDRDDFALLFPDALCILTAVQENVPSRDWCP